MAVKRRLGSWLLLVAMLVSLPGAASGRFVCLLGMPEAGPACAVCHGDPADASSLPRMESRCCEYRAGEETPALLQSRIAIERPAATQAIFISPSSFSTTDALHEADRRLHPVAEFRADLSPPPSFLSNFLRL